MQLTISSPDKMVMEPTEETSEVKKQSQSKSLVFNSELLEKEKDTNSQMGEGVNNCADFTSSPTCDKPKDATSAVEPALAGDLFLDSNDEKEYDTFLDNEDDDSKVEGSSIKSRLESPAESVQEVKKMEAEDSMEGKLGAETDVVSDTIKPVINGTSENDTVKQPEDKIIANTDNLSGGDLCEKNDAESKQSKLSENTSNNIDTSSKDGLADTKKSDSVIDKSDVENTAGRGDHADLGVDKTAGSLQSKNTQISSKSLIVRQKDSSENLSDLSTLGTTAQQGEARVAPPTRRQANIVSTLLPDTIKRSLLQGGTTCEIKIQPKNPSDPPKVHEVITYTMDQKANMVRKITQVPPLRTNVKASFNIQPSATTVPATESPSAQDIKDGHARLRPMSKFLYQVGLSMMRELVYEGLSEHVGKLRKQGDKKYSEEQYQSLQKSLSNLRKDNKDLHLVYDKVCPCVIDGKPCGFKTESILALETHLSHAHPNQKQKLVCARCENYTSQFPAHFKSHMMERHGVLGFTEKQASFFSCKTCHFDTNTSVRLQTHMANCSNSFQLNNNLKPDSISTTPLGENMFKPQSILGQPVIVSHHVTNSTKSLPNSASVPVKSRVITPLVTKPVVPAAVTKLQVSAGQPRVATSSTNLMPVVAQIGGKTIAGDVITCEICEGLIQGVQALKVHMQWCHNTNITHLKNPAFRCPKDGCNKLLWTVQGLAKHTATCKSVVKVPDSSSACFLCMKGFQTTLVEHLLAKHLSDLKKMVELKRCISMHCHYKEFPSVDALQNHLATEHRLKMTGLAGLASASVTNIKFQPFCSICKLKFGSSQEFARHCALSHVHKCDLCGSQCSTKQGLKEHEQTVHPFRFCLCCEKPVSRLVYQQHILVHHAAGKARVTLKRLADSDYPVSSKKPKLEN